MYRRGFVYNSLLYVIIGVLAQFFANFLLNVELVIIYAPLYLGVILIIGLFTKKKFTEQKGDKKAVFKEIPTITFLAYFLFLVSILVKAFILFVEFPNVFPFFPPFAQFALVLAVAETAFLISLIVIVMRGQRASIRINLGLDRNFFDNTKKTWKNQLSGFPRNKQIIEKLDEGKFILDFFDDGNFNVTILWTCNIMEKIIDEISKVLKKYPEHIDIKKTDSNNLKPYYQRIIIIGYEDSKLSKDTELTVETLWNEVRNKIGHHNKKPTHEQTVDCLRIFVNFIEETPKVLNKLDFLKETD